jgi:hypothetical protein
VREYFQREIERTKKATYERNKERLRKEAVAAEGNYPNAEDDDKAKLQRAIHLSRAEELYRQGVEQRGGAYEHGAPESQRRTVGPTDYDTPQYSSSSYNDTSQSFHYPRLDINMKPPTRWVYEWEDPHFYNMLLQQWQTTAAWTGQTWQDYKAELLRVQGLNVMSTAEYQMATQMGVFPFLEH